MNASRLIIAAAVLAVAGAAAHSADWKEESEAKLARMLEGRTAGESVSCIAMLRPNELEIIEGVAVVYDAGDTLYVARPSDPGALRRDDVVIIDRYGSQLCHSDAMHTVDRGAGFYTGTLFLGKFVPWKKQG